MKKFYQLPAYWKNNSSRINQMLIVSMLALLQPFLASAQESLTNTPYKQNFDVLPKSVNSSWQNNQTLKGWYIQQENNVPGVITPNNGSNSNPGVYSLGDGAANDRSLGSISTVATGKHVYVLRLVNNTNTVVNKINVAFTLEQWWNNPGSNERFGVSYLTGNTSAINAIIQNKELHGSSNWAVVTSKINTPSKGKPGYKEGDTKMVSLDVNLSLAVGQEILIRFEDAMSTKKNGYNAIGIDDVSITANPNTNSDDRVYRFVGVSNGNQANRNDLLILSNWKNKSNKSPVNFTDNFQTFVIDVPKNGPGNGSPDTGNPALKSGQNWVVKGQGSKVILGNGSTGFSLTIPQDASFTGTIDLRSNSIFNIDDENNFDLNLDKTPLIDIDVVEENATVNYRGTNPQYISEADYSILNVSGAKKYLYGSSSARESLNLSAANIYLNEFDLLVGDGTNKPGILTRTQGYIITTGLGSLQRFVPNGSTALFPVGSAENDAANNQVTYSPANVVQNGTSDLLSVRVLDGYYENYNPSTYQPNGDQETQGVVKRSWIMEEATIGGSNINLALQWPSAANGNLFIPVESKLLYFDFNNADWAEIINSAYVGGNSLQVAGTVTALGVFSVGVGGQNAPLPVELISFKGVREKGEVALKWQTAMEKNNDYFTLEQSTDGKTFNELAKVKGAGNTNQQQYYSYQHRNAPAQIIYYRLKQTDFDGTFTYSKVIVVKGSSQLATLAVYPNPSTGQFTLQGVTNITAATVMDAAGRTVLNLLPTSLNNEIGLNINLTEQKPGIYFLRLTGPTETQTLRLIKK
ncbi:T9SS type A sorting domain-containing protein [Adhaeribacter rhizoryzae]|uniref:T9SS type A sorting domain-containing protein n=1 Tax=Adhaeribacter rhizoryzae TaxID=2607907 RepID=A0A5M6DEX3_9BACT|nr:T9SS type A sorting domain-containing protein [Adhaeribacter rhizoryzae]KAA5544956.1 T9SS type A sorting domain-containing protein [Adhaeribacter rhizoryzae]